MHHLNTNQDLYERVLQRFQKLSKSLTLEVILEIDFGRSRSKFFFIYNYV